MIPLVSVIIPTYNREALVCHAIDSVISQTYQNIEIIVVDDGSTDNTKNAINKYRTLENFSFIEQSNKGVSAARNHGVSLAKGKYISLLDSDDLFLPTKIAVQVNHFEANPNIVLLHHYFEKIDLNQKSLGVRKPDYFYGFLYPKILYYWKSLINPSCLMVKKSMYEKVSGFNETLLSSEDLDFYRKISRLGEFHIIPKSLAKVRVHDGNYSVDLSTRDYPFYKYLQRAFIEDENITIIQEKKSIGIMYAFVALNMVGKNTQDEMKIARKKSLKALSNWPLQTMPIFVILFTFIPFSIRSFIYQIVAKIKYPTSRENNDF